MKRAAAWLGALLFCSCGADDSPATGGGDGAPVLIVAVDGFEWNVILPLLREGRMPTVATLMERGTFGTLKPMKPSKSPRLWTTIATGKPPSQHGILDFTREEDGAEVLYTSADRKVKAFWNILGDRGIASDTIGWWVTFPAEPVRGSMVSQTNTEVASTLKGGVIEGLAGQVWPEELGPEVFAAFDAVERGLDAWMLDTFGLKSRRAWPAAAREKWDECRWAFRADRTYLGFLRGRLAAGPPARVTSIYVGGTDVVGHRFWTAYEPEAFEPRPDPQEVELFGEVIPRYYEFVDGVLAELLDRFPPDTTVVVVADHGMERGQHDGDEPGVFLAAGPGVRASGADPAAVEVREVPDLGRLVDVCPTVLALVGVPYGADMLGRPMASVLAPSVPDSGSVPTHDDAAWLEGRTGGAGLRDAERIEQLRQLGYLGGEDDEGD